MTTAVKLPPSRRDFEVYHFLKDGGSTRQAAARFGVSQTRVRQLARGVVTWAAEVLPPEMEAETAGLLRVAVSVAGDRLDYFYQQTMEQWHATHQVKFLGLALRITQASARLPCRSYEIDAAAADLLEGPLEEWEPGLEDRESVGPPVEDCSLENADRDSPTKAEMVSRDASRPGPSKLGVLLANDGTAEQQRMADARTLLSPAQGTAVSGLQITPEALGLSVEETLQRFARRKRRAK